MKTFDMSCRQMSVSIDEGRTNLDTPYQRQLAWARRQNSLLMAFIQEQSREDQYRLRLLPVVFNRTRQVNDYLVLDSIDGKQRGNAIRSFRASEFKLTIEGCPYLFFMSNDLRMIAVEMLSMYPDRAVFLNFQSMEPLDTNEVLESYGYKPVDTNTTAKETIPSISDEPEESEEEGPSLEKLAELTDKSKFSKTAVVNLRGLTYKELCPTLKTRFDKFPITVWTTEIEDEWVTARYFQCTNNGSPLSSSEVLKAVSASRSFINEVSGNSKYFTGKGGVASVEQIAMVLSCDSPAFDKKTMSRFLASPFTQDLQARIVSALDYLSDVREILSQRKDKDILKLINKRAHQIILAYIVDENHLYDDSNSMPKFVSWLKAFFSSENDSKEKQRYDVAVHDGLGKMTSILARIEILSTDYANYVYTPASIPTGDETLD